ncbi:hypothetical protein [Proteiniborus sp.]|uniref:hypothetical protein n=1 Tax=Proteiniborus sp. TaxID=2079015 RepID=UPI00332C1A72
MNIDLVKQRISNKKSLRFLLAILIVILLFLYLKYFFTTGVFYDDAFLKKQGEYPNIQYIGKAKQGIIQISVKALTNKQDSIDVNFRLPNDINKQYNVSFKDVDYWGYSNLNIKDENGNTVFHGQYIKDSPFLFDENGTPFWEEAGIIVNKEINYNEDYKIFLKSIADFAALANEGIRGEFGYLVLAIIIFALTLIDIKYPLLFFSLNHMFTVKDPEPSDFYISMQQISWVVMPIIGLILLIVAVI